MAKKKNRVTSKVWKKYKIINDKVERSRTCIKCGPGYFLAEHKDRWYCGNCHYSEMKKK